MRRITLILAALALVGCGIEEGYTAPVDMRVSMLLPLQEDSARYAVSWSAPEVGPRQYPTERYETRVTLDGEEVYLRTDVAHPQIADTIALPWPALEETEGPYQAHVRAVDVSGRESEWVSSTEWDVFAEPLPPSPPGDVDVDEVAVPGTVGDLEVIDATSTSVWLAWTEVDDGYGGSPFYEIRAWETGTVNDYFEAPIVEAGSCAYRLWGEAPGERITCEVAGLEPATEYTFQLRAGRLNEDDGQAAVPWRVALRES